MDDSSKENEQFYLIDLAVKIKEIELVRKSDSSFLLYPAIEWHRNSQTGKETDKLSGALRAEYRPFVLAGFSADDERLSSYCARAEASDDVTDASCVCWLLGGFRTEE